MKIESMKEMMTLLAEVEPSDSPVLSCFVNLKQHHQAAADEIGRQAAVLSRTLKDEQKQCFDQALEEITQYLIQTPLPNAGGAALYARAGEQPFFYILSTGVAFESEFIVDDLPHLYPLVETRDTYHRFVVVTLTAREARIFETTAGSITNEILTERPDLRQKIGREWTRERYQNHKSDRKNRFVQAKIDVVEELMAKRGHNHLIVAGSPKMVSMFTNALPARLREMLVDTLDVNPKAGINPIILEAIESFVAIEHQESHDHVAQLESAIMRKGLGVSGEQATREALEHGYCDMLIIDQDYADKEAKEELVRMAVTAGVEIETVKESVKLAQLSGVGCLLRYRPSHIPSELTKQLA